MHHPTTEAWCMSASSTHAAQPFSARTPSMTASPRFSFPCGTLYSTILSIHWIAIWTCPSARSASTSSDRRLSNVLRNASRSAAAAAFFASSLMLKRAGGV